MEKKVLTLKNAFLPIIVSLLKINFLITVTIVISNFFYLLSNMIHLYSIHHS